MNTFIQTLQTEFKENTNPKIALEWNSKTNNLSRRKDFWSKQAIKNGLENEKFILTKELKSILLNQDLSNLDSDLQNRLSILLSDN